MSIEIGLLVALAGAGISAATFFIGRQTTAKKEGEAQGFIKLSLERLTADVKEIKEDLRRNQQATIDLIHKEEISRIDADKRLHSRIDEHIAMFHMRKGDGS
jgi:hypothetical protein